MLSFPSVFIFFLELQRPSLPMHLIAKIPCFPPIASSNTMVVERKESQGVKAANARKKPVVDPRVASHTRGKWRLSTVDQEQLDWLSTAGYLPPSGSASAHSGLIIKDGASWSVRVPNTAQMNVVVSSPTSCAT